MKNEPKNLSPVSLVNVEEDPFLVELSQALRSGEPSAVQRLLGERLGISLTDEKALEVVQEVRKGRRELPQVVAYGT